MSSEFSRNFLAQSTKNGQKLEYTGGRWHSRTKPGDFDPQVLPGFSGILPFSPVYSSFLCASSPASPKTQFVETYLWESPPYLREVENSQEIVKIEISTFLLDQFSFIPGFFTV